MRAHDPQTQMQLIQGVLELLHFESHFDLLYSELTTGWSSIRNELKCVLGGAILGVEVWSGSDSSVLEKLLGANLEKLLEGQLVIRNSVPEGLFGATLVMFGSILETPTLICQLITRI